MFINWHQLLLFMFIQIKSTNFQRKPLQRQLNIDFDVPTILKLEPLNKMEEAETKDVREVYDENKDQLIINEQLKKTPTFIISLKNCPYCTQAADAFKKMNEEYTWLPSEKKEELSNAVRNYYGIDTFPKIFVKGVYIGGYSDLKEKMKDKEI